MRLLECRISQFSGGAHPPPPPPRRNYPLATSQHLHHETFSYAYAADSEICLLFFSAELCSCFENERPHERQQSSTLMCYEKLISF